MVALPALGQRARRWSFRVPRLVSGLRAMAVRLVQPHRAALGNLASMPLTVTGVGCIDCGVFLASTIAGWIVTGLSLVLVEHLIADES